jgi:predicted aspartyl protease
MRRLYRADDLPATTPVSSAKLCAVLALLCAQPLWAQETARPGPLDDSGEPDATSTVTVEAPEPLYVAPTLRDRIGRIWAPVIINGKGPYRLVLDTGATTSAIIPSVANSLGLPFEQSTKLKLNGVTGTAMVSYVTADQIEVGELLMENVRLPIVPDVFGGAEGVLGGSGLRDKRVFIDFDNDLIRISRSQGKRAPEGYTRVPLMNNRLQLPMFELTVGTVRTKAILDTGAQQTIGNQNLREALLRRAREARAEDIVGVTLDVAQGTSLAVPPLTLGAISVRNMRVNFGSMYIFEHWKLTAEPVMVIGMDVIGTLESFVIDYKLKELQLRARR